MKEKKDCKIIQDLLPNYIDGLTNSETNEFIKNHLNKCNDCQKILDNMKKDFDLKSLKKDNCEVNYIKKFQNHLRTFQLILLIILLTFLLIIGRKVTILIDLKEKAENYANSSNYYMKISNYSSSNLITETYRKDHQFKNIIAGSLIQYYKNGTLNVYHKNNDILLSEEAKEFYVTLNSSQGFFAPIPSNIFSETSFLDLLKVATLSSISSEICNGKECYRIVFKEYTHDTKMWENAPNYEEENLSHCIVYLNKTTGLPIRTILPAGRGDDYDPVKDYGTDGIRDYYYSFDTVTDKPFIEPDISQCEILQNGED